MDKNLRLLKTDANGSLIQAGIKIEDIVEVSISSASWEAVTIPAAIYPTSIYVTTRDQADFLLSRLALGTRYSTLPSGFGIDLAPNAEETIFYVKGTTTTTLEVMLLG